MDSGKNDILIDELRRHADEKYRIFNEGLTPGAQGRSIGVRMPTLRKIAKKLLKDRPPDFLDASLGSEIHELNLLHAVVLASYPCDFAERTERLRAFVPTIGNWAVCDVLCNDLRISENERAPFREFLESFIRSAREFEVRFGCVMLMLNYDSDEWIESTLAAYAAFHHEGYYARMAVAWGLSSLFVSQRERTLEFLKNDTLDRFTHNKAIQKISESLRVGKEDKQMLRTLKRPEPR